MSKIYLVTGAAGHLGAAVTRILTERGEYVRAFLLPTDREPLLPLEIYRGDVRDKASMHDFFAHADGDELIVIHCAGIVSIATQFDQRVWDVNVTGVQNVTDLCVENKVSKYIYISSVHAIPELPKGSVISEVSEFDPDRVKGLYAKTKAAASAYVLQKAREGLNAVIIHPSGICGPYDSGRGHITALVMDYCNHKLTSGVSGGYDFVDVRDVASGIVAACDKGKRGESYILSNKYIKVADLLELLHEVTGKRRVYCILPLWFAKGTAALAENYYRIRKSPPLFTKYSLYTLESNSAFTHEKASVELGYTTRDMRETITDTISWLVSQGRINLEKQPKRGKCHAT